MAKQDTFHCSVITPDQAVLQCDAKFVAFPAHDGEMGVLPQRAALLCKLGIGVLRVETADEKHELFIDGGFGQVIDNRLTLLTQQARKADEVDRTEAEKALEEAKSMSITDEPSFQKRQDAIQRAKVQMKFAR